MIICIFKIFFDDLWTIFEVSVFMEYYCLLVKTGEEEKFKGTALEKLSLTDFTVDFYFFQRSLKTNQGKVFENPLFPGYIFFSTEQLVPELMMILKKVKGFIRFLIDNTNPIKIVGRQLEELRIFIRNGEHWGISKVEFLPGKNVRAISGPLVGLEGKIYKVNKKRGRVTIMTSLSPDGRKIDLAFESVQLVDEGK